MSSPTIDFAKVIAAVEIGIEAIGGEEFDTRRCECKYDEEENIIKKCQYCALHEAMILARSALKQSYVVALADDYEALYVNGKLRESGSSVNYPYIMDGLGFNVEVKNINQNWLEKDCCGEFPLKLKDCWFER